MKIFNNQKEEIKTMRKDGYIGLILEVTGGKEADVLPLRESDIASIEEAIDSLRKIQSKHPLNEIIRYRFGLSRKKLTLIEVGRIYNVGSERVRQYEVKALRKIRHSPRREAFFRLLRSFLEERLDFFENERRDPILGRSIYDFELSVRTYNCLMNAGIKTVGDLLQRTGKELLRTKNLGVGSLREIEGFLKSHDLSLKE